VSEAWTEFKRRRDGMQFALDGGVWLHRYRLDGRPMAHVVSADKEKLLALGEAQGWQAMGLQYKPLKDPRTGVRKAAWHWDLWGRRLEALGGG
jgi:hypothetical protein